jgi:aryl-alcohol dehydrogenase-like predicted oxidoreductase
MEKRKLGKSGIEVSAMGLGCWAIAGGWGTNVTDEESIKSIQLAMELGVTLLDTAEGYGAGKSEQLIAKAIKGKRDQMILATKFYPSEMPTDEKTWRETIVKSCENSLKNLNTDYIDNYIFHVFASDDGVIVRNILEELVEQGKIRSFGWSTDFTERAAIFAESKNCATIEQQFNIFEGNKELLALCEEKNMASLDRGPLAMGLLTGKFKVGDKAPDDVRSGDRPWIQVTGKAPGPWNLKDGNEADYLKKLDIIKDIITSDGRTLTQGALGWLWARSPACIPIPGFKTRKQVKENCGALQYGALSDKQMSEIDTIINKK